MSSTDEIVAKIIGGFARAVIDPAEWMPALKLMSENIGSASCSLELADLNTGLASINCTCPLDDHVIEQYEERIYHINPRVRRARALPVGMVVDDRALLVDGDPDMAEFMDWLEKTPNRYVQGGKLFQGGGHEIYFGSYFAADHGPPKQSHFEVHRRITPHLLNFVAAGRSLSGGMLNNKIVAIEQIESEAKFALLDRSGRVVECSVGFEATLRSSSVLTARDRKLSAVYAAHRNKVDHFLQSATENLATLEPVMPVRLAAPQCPLGLILRAVPLEPANNVFDVFSPVALITLTDLDRPGKIKCGELVDLFDLTPREAEVTALVSAGLSTAQAAERLSIGEHTVKQHLKAVFGKIGLSRQPELVAMISRLT